MNRREFNRLSAVATALSLTGRSSFGETFDYPWKLGVISDEVDFDLSRVLSSFVPKYQLHWIEIRELTLDGKRTYVYRGATPDQLKQVKKQLDDAGIKLSVLDTAIYKIRLPGTTPLGKNPTDLNPGQGEYDRQTEDLKRASDAAHTLGTEKLRLFTYNRIAQPDTIFDRIVEDLHKALDLAKQQDVVLVVENEQSCNIATGTESARLLRAINDRRLMLNWDPGNCAEAGEQPYPKGWDQFDHTRIGHVHLKDFAGGSWKPVGKGNIDFVGQFEALKAMKYSGTMSLETHYRNPQNDRYMSSVESMDGLVSVLKKV